MAEIATEQKVVELDGEMYVVNAFPAQYGLSVMEKMIKGDISTTDMVDIIKRSVDYQGRQFNDKSFGVHFSRRYNVINELFEEIMKFNFGEGEEENPLEENSSDE